MNIWNIAVKEIKSNLRNRRTFIFMLAMPIVLILILGAALSNAFAPGYTMRDLHLLYKSNAIDPQLTTYWHGFIEEISKEGVKAVEAEQGMNGQDEVQNDRYTAYAEITSSGIKFYGSSKDTIESNILQGMLTVFADRYALASAAYQVEPAIAQEIVKSAGQSSDFIRESSLDPTKRPGSIDYYAIAMTTMIALYSIISASYLFRGERTRNTAIRLMAAPVSKGAIFAGKVIGCTVINLICVLLVVLFSKYALHADWGDHYGMVVLVLLTEVLVAVSLGLGVSFLAKAEGSRLIVMIFTQVASFVGGAYFPVDDATGVLGFLTYLSPIRWANTALMQLIYADNSSAAWSTIGLNVGIAALVLIAAVISIRKREAF
ncbi:ABC transporter permease [Brevibacillus reuszeri]|uniref:ABC transporter permease n=1 Tax=Brevibacillus reuszeri TaxID=54915 RepID=A0A0K9Z0I3_9BACL|nr:ABC transporter permease [Brevibacillus reuszeri]KNB74426.1 ABC transporter permease [Brevibacillus reuszeri]MED1856343.1 ABC transporter permease subunit [Brevibacillus reuszeri]GED67962.1 ABC transporter permease [Brevibacillus reuszeri]